MLRPRLHLGRYWVVDWSMLRPRLGLGPYWIGFMVCSFKNVEKALVLLCFRSKISKQRRFYCVFAQHVEKQTNIGFTKPSPTNMRKYMVLQ